MNSKSPASGTRERRTRPRTTRGNRPTMDAAAPTAAQEDLLFEIRDGIARVTFNRPQARNAFTFAMYERLAELCGLVNEDDGVRAMVLTGAGEKAFAAGTDISQFRAFKTPQDAI